MFYGGTKDRKYKQREQAGGMEQPLTAIETSQHRADQQIAGNMMQVCDAPASPAGAYNGNKLQLVARCQAPENGEPVYSGATRK